MSRAIQVRHQISARVSRLREKKESSSRSLHSPHTCDAEGQWEAPSRGCFVLASLDVDALLNPPLCFPLLRPLRDVGSTSIWYARGIGPAADKAAPTRFAVPLVRPPPPSSPSPLPATLNPHHSFMERQQPHRNRYYGRRRRCLELIARPSH